MTMQAQPATQNWTQPVNQNGGREMPRPFGRKKLQASPAHLKAFDVRKASEMAEALRRITQPAGCATSVAE
jgi:hypothetical protein